MDEVWRDVRSNDEPGCGWQGPQTRFKRGESQHELEVLRHEEEVSEGDEYPQEVGDERRVETAYPEQRHVDQWALEPPLTADEEDAYSQTDEDRQGRQWVEPAFRCLLEPVDHGEDRNQRHPRRDQIEFTSVWVPVLGENARPEDEE